MIAYTMLSETPSFVVHSLPHLLCLDDEVITNKERGVAKDVIKLFSSVLWYYTIGRGGL